MGDQTKMAMVSLANLDHADFQQYDQAVAEDYSLPQIGESGVPVSLGIQTLDLELRPELKRLLERYPSIELMGSTFSHVLMPLVHPEHQRWQLQNGPQGQVTFLSEFATPPEVLPDVFLVQGQESACYTYDEDALREARNFINGADDPHRYEAIHYRGKLGLVMRQTREMVKPYFEFQCDPEGKIDALIESWTRQLNDYDGDVIIMPMDTEACFIGSAGWGSKINEKLFAALRQSGLADRMVTLSQAAKILAPKAVETSWPGRDLIAKWTGSTAQLDYVDSLRNFFPATERQHKLLAVAAISDALVGIRYQQRAGKQPFTLSGKTLEGLNKTITIGPHPDILTVCQAARWALMGKSGKSKGSFRSRLRRKGNMNSLFVQDFLNWAEREEL